MGEGGISDEYWSIISLFLIFLATVGSIVIRIVKILLPEDDNPKLCIIFQIIMKMIFLIMAILFKI